MKSKVIYTFTTILSLIGCSLNRNQQNIWEKVDLSVNSDAKIVSPDPEPKYPKEALATNKSGSVDIAFLVDEFGNPKNITIIKETPQGFGFGISATHQVSKLKFVPGVSNGKRVKQRFKRTYVFNSDSKDNFNLEPKEFKSFDLTYCTDPQLSLWASKVREAAYNQADSIVSVDSGYKPKCFVHFIVNQAGGIFNLESKDCEIGYKSIHKMGHTPPLPAGFKPDTIAVTLEFDPNRIK